MYCVAFAQPTLDETLLVMSISERHFFEVLDEELAKVENFYKEREKEYIIQSSVLKEQLRELQDHRKLFHVCFHVMLRFNTTLKLS